MTMIESLVYSMIDINIIVDFREWFLIGSLIFVNDMISSAVLLLKLTIAIVVIFVVLKLTVLACSITVVYLRLLRVVGQLRIVRSVHAFISLTVLLFSSVLIRFTIQI